MIYKKLFLENRGNLVKLNQALSLLHEINYFAVAMELSVEKTAMSNVVPAPSSEQIALAKMFAEGYLTAIEDLIGFNSLFDVVSESKPQDKLTFGAVEDLINKKIITEKEADELKLR